MSKPMQLSTRRAHERRARRKRHLRGFAFGGTIFLIACFFLTQYAKAPLSSHEFSLPIAAASEPKPQYVATPQWSPEIIAGAVGAKDAGIIAKKNGEAKRPIASVAKLITALAVLEKHPLKDDQDLGPRITLTKADEASYNRYLAKNGAVVPAKAGTTIHLKHALQAMILPSANNIADTTALWAFGSMDNYHEYATKMLRRLGMNHTTVGGDASGFDPKTQSTATDLVRLGEASLKSPILATIAAQKEFNLPGVGVFPNYNRLVVEHNYTGLKPGNTDEAGGTMIFSLPINYKNKKVTLIGVVLGTKSGGTPYNSALQLSNSTQATLRLNR
jgi:serine-type D-Ala-D-Ala carboxypeptidase (penicillin-binding protein 5/6)